jgi:hypothetical protein
MQNRTIPAHGLLVIPLAAECAELKLLHGSPGCGVVMSARIDQFKALSEDCSESVRVVTADRQAAAAFRAVGAKVAMMACPPTRRARRSRAT